MKNKTRITSICLCVIGLSACTASKVTTDTAYQPYTYHYDSPNYYPETYEASTMYYAPMEKKAVEVPDSYHVGSSYAPTPHRNVDKQWVNSQSAQSYTIEVADGEKPSQVANTLHKAPKDQRTAEVRYQREGKAYYKGLYGTYPTYEAAQQALSKLPADVKDKAGIKTWGTLQQDLNRME
jgi:septal ring-binding cell division protein DamX